MRCQNKVFKIFIFATFLVGLFVLGTIFLSSSAEGSAEWPWWGCSSWKTVGCAECSGAPDWWKACTYQCSYCGKFEGGECGQGSASSCSCQWSGMVDCEPPKKPDLIVQNLSYTPPSPVAGNSMSFSGVVKNNGAASAGASTTRLRLDINNDGGFDRAWDQPTGALAPGATEGETWSNVWTALAGTHRYKICADATNVVSESYEGNNCATQTFTVAALPDLVVSNFEIRKPDPDCTNGVELLTVPGGLSGCAQPGEKLCARVVVKNQGDAVAGGSHTGFKRRGGVDWQPHWTGRLLPGEHEIENFSFNAPNNVQTYTATAKADINLVVNESREGNNAATTTYCVEAPPVPPPTCTLTANPSSGTAPLSGTLTWTTTNSPTSCTASGSWSGSKSTTGGSEGYGPLNTAGTYTYNLSCSNPGGTGTCSAVVTASPPVGMITGYIWNDADNNDGVGKNPLSEQNYTASPITVRYICADDGTGSVITSNGNYTLSNVPAKPCSVLYDVNDLAPGWSTTTPASVGVIVPAGGAVTANFGVWDNPEPWFQGCNGSVYGLGVSVAVPYDCKGCCDRWLLGADPGTSGGVVISGNATPSCSGRCSERPSGELSLPGWNVGDQAIDWPSSLKFFAPAGATTITSADPTLEPGKSYSWNLTGLPAGTHTYSVSGGGIASLYVNGNLAINGKFKAQNSDAQGVVIVVNGDVTINRDNVGDSLADAGSDIDAVVIASGTVTVTGNNPQKRLIIKGMLYGKSNLNVGGADLDDNLYPRLLTIYNALYHHPSNPLRQNAIKWREVVP